MKSKKLGVTSINPSFDSSMEGEGSSSGGLPYYTPTYKPALPLHNHQYYSSPNNKLLYLALLAIFCTLSYHFGTWQNGGGASGTSISSIFTAKIATAKTCLFSGNTATTLSSTTQSLSSHSAGLDFTTHHGDGDGGAVLGNHDEDSVKVYPPCDVKYSEYTPCEDTERSLAYDRERLIYRERHCPKKSEVLKCRIPAPFGYRNPFKWPESRDVAWYTNVPHKELTVEKAVQNWIRFEGDRFKFPGGGTMFRNGADAYIDDIGKLINLKDGSIRTALDTGCGVASFGAYLLSRNILTMSFAPRDTHQSQVQFALERGVPALIGILASKRLPYPSKAFDMAHCSRCLIPWGQYDGAYLIEVDRVLRPGGYWILSGPPIRWKRYWQGWDRTEEDLEAEQTQIEKVADSLCWKKFMEVDDIAIWQKPYNHMDCIRLRQAPPPMCPASNDPDMAWYTDLQTCLTPLPQVSDEKELEKWPKRLNAVPPRIKRGTIDGISGEKFEKDSTLWNKRISHYSAVMDGQLVEAGRYRNVLDMNAFLGGFAAALVDHSLWVMNVVPVESKLNTLGVIYERGLIGTYHTWCEAMSTYPRTYDLIHADSIFTLYKDRCEMEDILLEMDRILRPEGSVIIRDDVDVLIKVKRITDGLQWESRVVDHEDGPLQREKLLFAVKTYWTAPAA
ncbi:PREDICTED: probable methyltransferase PMT16 isoform X1 [Ipomoea nil]|uniref:probable methyltransferase PMT16 isoform X1 n=1 Tax=Ipomoea nil TaxID=35883 RepID=UPI000900D580|nr:PREDICTED: probable methyltransferase PMT16 isoform X1 [Ipomoea nil]